MHHITEWFRNCYQEPSFEALCWVCTCGTITPEVNWIGYRTVFVILCLKHLFLDRLHSVLTFKLDKDNFEWSTQTSLCSRFCLVLGYRTLGCTISDTLGERYIDVPFLKKVQNVKEDRPLLRSVSLDMECLKTFYRQLLVQTAHECFEEVMHGQTLCGLVVLQHQVCFIFFKNDVPSPFIQFSVVALVTLV